MKKLYILLAAVLPLTAWADSFDDIVRQVIDTNPTLSATAASMRAEALAAQAENTLPDTEIGGEYKWGPENRWGVEVSQSFDWPGVYAARSRAAAAATEARRLEHRAQVVALEVRVRSLLVELVHSRQRMALLEQMAANVDSVATLTQRLYDAREVSVLDLRKVQIESAGIHAQLREQRSAQTALATELNLLCSNPPLESIDLVTNYQEQSLLPLGYYMQLLVQRPEILAARALVEQSKREHTVELRRRLPGFSLGYVHDFEEGMHFNGISASVSLPLFGQRKAAAAAAARTESTEKQSNADFNAMVQELLSDYAEAEELTQCVADYEQTLAPDYVELLDKSLFGRQITVLDYLTELNFYLQSRLDLMALQRDLHLALTRLNSALPQ